MKAIDNAIAAQLLTTSTTLASLVGVKVYSQLAPQGIAKPFVTFNLQGGGEVNLEPNDRVNVLYLVKGIASDQASANSIADAIRERLHNQTFSITGWNLLACMRETEIQISERDPAGTLVWHRGALYRVRAAKA